MDGCLHDETADWSTPDDGERRAPSSHLAQGEAEGQGRGVNARTMRGEALEEADREWADRRDGRPLLVCQPSTVAGLAGGLPKCRVPRTQRSAQLLTHTLPPPQNQPR